jgi:hypothetical protein
MSHLLPIRVGCFVVTFAFPPYNERSYQRIKHNGGAGRGLATALIPPAIAKLVRR